MTWSGAANCAVPACITDLKLAQPLPDKLHDFCALVVPLDAHHFAVAPAQKAKVAALRAMCSVRRRIVLSRCGAAIDLDSHFMAIFAHGKELYMQTHTCRGDRQVHLSQYLVDKFDPTMTTKRRGTPRD
jgi:hypothetical protein